MLKQVKINVEGMSCGHCAKHVTSLINEINGVKKVTVNLDEAVANITFDDNFLTPENIVEIINNSNIYLAN